LTIRDIAISFGFQIDKTSETKANKTVEQLKTAASSALEAVGIKFQTDDASKQNVIDSVEAIKASTESIQDALVGFSTDTTSEQSVLDAVDRIKSEAAALAENVAGFDVDTMSENEVLAAVEGIKHKPLHLPRMSRLSRSIVRPSRPGAYN